MCVHTCLLSQHIPQSCPANKATKRFILAAVRQLTGHNQLKLTLADSQHHQINNTSHAERFRGDKPLTTHSFTHSLVHPLMLSISASPSLRAHEQLSSWKNVCQSEPLIQRHVEGDMSHMLRRGEGEWLGDREGGESKRMEGCKDDRATVTCGLQPTLSKPGCQQLGGFHTEVALNTTDRRALQSDTEDLGKCHRTDIMYRKVGKGVCVYVCAHLPIWSNVWHFKWLLQHTNTTFPPPAGIM